MTPFVQAFTIIATPEKPPVTIPDASNTELIANDISPVPTIIIKYSSNFDFFPFANFIFRLLFLSLIHFEHSVCIASFSASIYPQSKPISSGHFILKCIYDATLSLRRIYFPVNYKNGSNPRRTAPALILTLFSRLIDKIYKMITLHYLEVFNDPWI